MTTLPTITAAQYVLSTPKGVIVGSGLATDQRTGVPGAAYHDGVSCGRRHVAPLP